MKITAIEAIPVTIPFSHGGPPTGFGGTEWTTLPYLIVKVDTDEGLTGYGEAFGYNVIPATKTAIDTLVAPQAVGRDATQISALMDELFLKFHIFGRYGVTVFALSGLDIALWDIAGKAAGLPLHRLIGGARRDRVKAYASLLKYDDPAVVGRLTREALDTGYQFIKLHETTHAPVEAARAAAGDGVPIMVDVNCAWSPRQAAAMAERLAPLDLHWLEEPIWPPENFAALAELRADWGIPLASGMPQSARKSASAAKFSGGQIGSSSQCNSSGASRSAMAPACFGLHAQFTSTMIGTPSPAAARAASTGA